MADVAEAGERTFKLHIRSWFAAVGFTSFLVALIAFAVADIRTYFFVVTLSTLGYGDIVPRTNVVRVLMASEIVTGILLLLFGFSEIMAYSRVRRRRDA